jgi:type II protein arginine methyltransferase
MPGTDGAAATLVSPDTMLVRAQDVIVRLSNEDEVGIEVNGERYLAPRVALTVLDAFSIPRLVSEVLASLPKHGTEHGVEISTCIDDLVDRGVLVDPSVRGEDEATYGWVRPHVHVTMLDDRARTKGFCDALTATVEPGDVVVDIGTGTGILATRAAQSGARHVYAIESSGIAEVAARMFETNGVADRVTLVRRRSTSATLPELGSVLVTETIGNDPLDEQLLEIIADAKDRLLLPDARVIPQAIQIYGIAVDIPQVLYEKHVFTKRKLDAYAADYEMDFSTLAQHQLSTSEPIMVEAKDVLKWPMEAPALLAEVDFTKPFETWIAMRTKLTLTRDKQYLGVVLAFRAKLAERNILSTLPADTDERNHWAYALFPAFEHPALSKGDTIAIEYSYDRGSTTVRVVREKP